MILLDGKTTADVIKSEIKAEVASFIDSTGQSPHLAAILVGDDPASTTYVSHKEKDCKSVGITSSVYQLPTSVSEEQLLEVVDFINEDDEVHGLIVQLPLPNHIVVEKIFNHINPDKDVDGFHPLNIGRMLIGHPSFLPATPAGIIELLKRYKIETEGKHCVILGRSNIVGTPLGLLLSRKAKTGNATVTICHSLTRNLKEITLMADILVAALGKAEFVRGDMVKDGAVVIDVGIHRIPDTANVSGFRLIGDVHFDEVSQKSSYITPVPGGVGPMTRVTLLQNTLSAFKKALQST